MFQHPSAGPTPPEAEARVVEILAPCCSAHSAGDSRLHVAMDDFSHVAYAGLLRDEHKVTCATFKNRCLSFLEVL